MTDVPPRPDRPQPQSPHGPETHVPSEPRFARPEGLGGPDATAIDQAAQSLNGAGGAPNSQAYPQPGYSDQPYGQQQAQGYAPPQSQPYGAPQGQAYGAPASQPYGAEPGGYGAYPPVGNGASTYPGSQQPYAQSNGSYDAPGYGSAAPGAYPQQSYGQQDQPAQGYNQGYSQQGQAYGAGQYAAPQYAANTTSQGSKSKVPFMIGGGVLALALLGLGITQLAKPAEVPPATAAPAVPGAPGASSAPADPSAPPAGSAAGPGAVAPEQATSALLAVQGYYDALMRGDANGALAFAGSDPADKTYLTDEVLKASNAKYPITDLKLTESGRSTVSASYKLNGKPVSVDLSASPRGGNAFKVSGVARDISLSAVNPSAVGLTLNGKPVTATRITLFPGVYDLATSNQYLDLSNKNVTINSPSDYSTFDTKVVLKSGADATIKKAVKEKLNACVAMKKLNNPECGIQYNKTSLTGETADEKTLKCSVASGESSIDSSEVRLDTTDPRQAKGNISVKLQCNLKSTDGDPLTGTPSLYDYKVDLSANPIKVMFG